MATNYPYVSAQGALVKVFQQFRKAVPSAVDAELLKKFEIAPKNESYVINTLRFLGILGEDGKRIESQSHFLYENDEKFAEGLEERILAAYSPLFADHGDAAWTEPRQRLTSWFRVTDKTSDVVGGRQAQTFQTLAALAGHGEVMAPAHTKTPTKTATKTTPAKKAAAKSTTASNERREQPSSKDSKVPLAETPLGLSVRVEVNLPATGTPETYDSIFASIRKHLIDRD